MVAEDILKKVKPGARVRLVYDKLSFEGLVIARKHGSEPGATITVRTALAGVGVEKILPIHSPLLTKLDILSSPKKVHRSKLYWVRKASGAKIRQRLGVSA